MDTQNQILHTIPTEIYGTRGQSNETKFDLLLLALYNLNESWHQLLINWYILYYAQETKMTWHCGYQNCTTMHFHKALKYWMQYEIQMGCSDWPQVLASKFLPFFDFKKILAFASKRNTLIYSKVRILCLELAGQGSKDLITLWTSQWMTNNRAQQSPHTKGCQHNQQYSLLVKHEVDIYNRTYRRGMVRKEQGEGYNHQHLQTFCKIHFQMENATKIA